MVMFVLSMLVVGLIAGFIARAVVPGTDAMGILGTILLGIVGSLVGGFLAYLLFHKDAAAGAFQTSGLIGSIVGAIVVLIGLRFVRGRA